MRNNHIMVYAYMVFQIAMVLGCLSPIYAQTARYVSPAGNDGTGDGTEGNPWLTIQYAVNQAVAGDTIYLMDDDNESTDDYAENVSVAKSLTIQRYDSDSTAPRVKASNPSSFVLSITVDNVTIKGLDIYGATSNGAAINLDNADNCVIENNRCGWDTSHKNYIGINSWPSSQNNTITGNTCSFNAEQGIRLSQSNSNTVSSNTCNNNGSEDPQSGIALYESSYNKILGNTCNANFCSGVYLQTSNNDNVIWNNICIGNNEWGIHIIDGSNNNTISGNTCNNNSVRDGIEVRFSCLNNNISGNTFQENSNGIFIGDSTSNNTISGNIVSNNTGNGMYVNTNSNRIYLNTFTNNNSKNLYNDGGTANVFQSPTQIVYSYQSKTCQNYMGNHYGDYSGSDAKNDGIGDNTYTEGGASDSRPLMQTEGNYDLQAWWLANPYMHRNDMSTQGDRMTIGNGSTKIWTTSDSATEDISYPSAPWKGQLTFTSAPGASDTFTIEIGYADGTNGSNFWNEGPEATLTGDESKTALVYETDTVSFTLPKGKYLAIRVKNNSTTDYTVRVGGSWSYCSMGIPVSSERSVFDFDGDGKSDILWRQTTGTSPGTNRVWIMDSSTITQNVELNKIGSDWTVAGIGDFDGDDKSDVLWRLKNGSIVMWKMDGATIANLYVLKYMDTNWNVAGIADFNGDSKSDILWYKVSGNSATCKIWFMNGSDISEGNDIELVDNRWKVGGVGDFDGDGKKDILWRLDDYSNIIWLMDGETIKEAAIVEYKDSTWSIAGTGDFNGDGSTDILWRSSSGVNTIWLMNGKTIGEKKTIDSLASTSKVVEIGDFNGDTKADILWRLSPNTTIWFMDGGTVTKKEKVAINMDGTWAVVGGKPISEGRGLKQEEKQ